MNWYKRKETNKQNNLKHTIMKTRLATKDIYLTIAELDRDLETCLTITRYPSKKKPYYVCEYISAALYKSIVHVYIKK